MFAIKRIIKNILLILLMILLLFILGALICAAMIMQDDNTDKYTAQPSNEIVTQLAKDAFLNSESYLDEESINGLIAYLIDRADENGHFEGDLKPKAAYIDIESDSPCRLYACVDYRGFDVGVSANADIHLSDDVICIEISDAYAGKLKLPEFAVTYVLGKIRLSNSEINIDPENMTIEIPARYSVDAGSIYAKVNIELRTLEFLHDEVHVVTNDIVNDVLENNDLFEIFKKMIGDQIYNNVREHTDDIVGFITEHSDKIPDSVKDYIGDLSEY